MPARERVFAVLIVVWLALVGVDLATRRHGFWPLLVVALAGLFGDCFLLYKTRRLRLDTAKADATSSS
jgi:hypothetical protein